MSDGEQPDSWRSGFDRSHRCLAAANTGSELSDRTDKGIAGSLERPSGILGDDSTCVDSLKRWPPKARALALALVANALLFALLFLFLTPGFETNDDLTMRLIASGFYTRHPSEYLVFTNVIIGLILKSLYNLTADTNWYLIYLISTHFAALTGLCFLVLKHRPGRVSFLLCLAFSLLVEVRIFLNLQFTTSAFLLGAAGVFLLADGFIRERPIDIPQIVVGFGFLAVTTMIRDSVALLVGAMALPVLALGFRWSRWRSALTILSVSAEFFFGLTSLNKWYYQRQAGWGEFFEYNRIRGKFHLTPLQPLVPQAGRALGWTANDAAMFVNFYFSDPEVYGGVNRMRGLDQAVQAITPSEALIGRLSFRDLCLPDLLCPETGPIFGLAALGCGLCVLLAGQKTSEYAITLLLLYFALVAMCFYIRETARLPARVAYNIPIFLCCLALYWASFLSRSQAGLGPVGGAWSLFGRIAGRARPVLVAVGAGFCAMFLFEFAANLSQTNQRNYLLKRESGKIFQFAANLSAPGRPPIIVALPSDTTFEQSLFFFEGNRPPFAILPYGWLSHSPISDEILSQHDLIPYSESVVCRPDVFFLMQERWITPLKIFYREHYGLDMRFEAVAGQAWHDDPESRFYIAEPFREDTRISKPPGVRRGLD